MDTICSLTKITEVYDIIWLHSNAENMDRPCIIIDDLSLLLYLGFTVCDIILLINSLSEKVYEKGGNLVVFLHNDCKDDAEQVMLNEHLFRMSNLRIDINPLSSGFSDGIDGQVPFQIN